MRQTGDRETATMLARQLERAAKCLAGAQWACHDKGLSQDIEAMRRKLPSMRARAAELVQHYEGERQGSLPLP